MGHPKFIAPFSSALRRNAGFSAAVFSSALLAAGVCCGLVACQGEHQEGRPVAAPGKTTAARFPVTFRPRANGIGSGLRTDLVDHRGHPIKARCGSCHAGKAPKRSRRTGASLKIFHSGLKMRHGKLSCLTCHNDSNYDTLRLADDTEVPFDSLMTLCAQCHGTQKRDYDHGSHGGMSGYWDLTRGPRVRNQCVHCHDPHAPAYVGVVPAPGPQDRFLQQAVPGSEGH